MVDQVAQIANTGELYNAAMQTTYKVELYNEETKAPAISDIREGSTQVGASDDGTMLGDCWLLADMAAVVQKNPNAIKNMIHANPDGSYTVDLYETEPDGSLKATQEKVSLADLIPGGATHDATQELDPNNGEQIIWPGIIEAAVAKLVGGTTAVTKTLADGTVVIDHYELKGGDATPLSVLTGQTDLTITMNFSEIQTAFKNGDLITMGVAGDATEVHKLGKYNIPGKHELTVTNVYTDINGQECVSFYNPWGYASPQDVPFSDVEQAFGSISACAPPVGLTITHKFLSPKSHL